MRRREKIGKRLIRFISVAIIVQIFILLAVQLFFFIDKIIERGFRYSDYHKSDHSYVADSLYLTPSQVNAQANTHSETQFPSRRDSSVPVATTREAPRVKDASSDIALQDEEPHINIGAGADYRPYQRQKPLRLELNRADSASLVKLYGIGGYYASRILEYRSSLGGSFGSVYQLLEIWGMDSVRFEQLLPYIYIDSSTIRKIDYRNMPLDSLSLHPYIGKFSAKGIVRYRETYPQEEISIKKLLKNGIINEEKARCLSLYGK